MTDRVRVLFSFGPPERSRNPFTALVAGSVGDAVDVSYFSWRAAFTSTYDVFHVHWPEALLKDTRKARRVGRWTAFMLLLAVLQVRRRRVVWTVHNRRPHADARRSTRWALQYLHLRTDVFVVLFRFEVEAFSAGGRRAVWIPHGPYPVVHRPGEQPRGARTDLALFGLIRPYKQIESLLEAFSAATEPDHLVVAGRPMPAGYGDAIGALAAGDPRVEVRLRFLAEDELAALLAATSLAVFPYRDLYSSGAVLLALSHRVPVLLPASAVAAELRSEIGREWVLEYTGALTGATLDDAVREVGKERPAGPDLSARTWTGIGQAHVDLYRSLVA